MKNTILVNGKRKTCRIYDDGGKTADRYTVVYRVVRLSDGTRYYPYTGMGCTPFAPTGICQHGEARTPIDRPSGKHLGKRIAFESLNEDCQRVIIDYLSR
jgi:hypothetical protein